ncbi:hypothetical protein BG000_000170, partial [Podila horticola]
MTANSSPATEQTSSPSNTDFLITWKQNLLVSDVARLKLPSSFTKSSKPKRVALSTLPSSSVVNPDHILEQSRVPHWDHCREYVNLPLPLADAIQYSNSAAAFPLSSLKFLDEIYNIRVEHQRQFKEFLGWVPTILSKYHPALATRILDELHNTRACLNAVLPSTQMSIPATSCFANERWLDIDCLQACLDALNRMYNSSGNILILPIDLAIYVTSNDDHSDYHCKRTFGIKSLTDILGIFPMKVGDCKEGNGCYCDDDNGCKDGCNCDDHCACNGPGYCDHARPCICEPDHWAFFWLDMQHSKFLFGDSLGSDQPAARITRLKNFIAKTLHTDQNESGKDEQWPTLRYDMPNQPDNSGSCGIIALNAIQHALDPSIPIWTPDNNQEHRAHLLELASRRKSNQWYHNLTLFYQSLVKWSPSYTAVSSFDTADQSTPPSRLSPSSTAAESSPSRPADLPPLTSTFTLDPTTNSSPTADTASLSSLSPTRNQDSTSNTFYDNASNASPKESIIPGSNSNNNSNDNSSSSIKPNMRFNTISTLPNERINPESNNNIASPKEPVLPDKYNNDAANNGTQPCTEGSTSILTFPIDPTTLPIDYNFTETVFETPDHALQTIYAFANAHQFPV